MKNKVIYFLTVVSLFTTFRLKAQVVSTIASNWKSLGQEDFGNSVLAGKMWSHWADPNSNGKRILVGGFYNGVWEGKDLSTTAGVEDWNWKCLTHDFFPSCRVNAIDVNPINPNIIFAIANYGYDFTNTFKNANLIFSADNGITWQIFPFVLKDDLNPANIFTHDRDIWDIKFVPGTNDLLVTTDHELFVINATSQATILNGFSLMKNFDLNPAGKWVFEVKLDRIFINPANPDNIFITHQNSSLPINGTQHIPDIFFTMDAGVTWHSYQFPIPSSSMTLPVFYSSVTFNSTGSKAFVIATGHSGGNFYEPNSSTSFSKAAKLYEFDISNPSATSITPLNTWTIDMSLMDAAIDAYSGILVYVNNSGKTNVFIGLTQSQLAIINDIYSNLTTTVNNPIIANPLHGYYDINNVHADSRSISFVNNKLYIAHDGGISKCDNLLISNSPTFKSLNGKGFNSVLAVGFDCAESTPYQIALAAGDGESVDIEQDNAGNLNFLLDSDYGDQQKAAVDPDDGERVLKTINSNGTGATNFETHHFYNRSSSLPISIPPMPFGAAANNINPDEDNFYFKPLGFDRDDKAFYTGTIDLFRSYTPFNEKNKLDAQGNPILNSQGIPIKISDANWEQVSFSSSKNDPSNCPGGVIGGGALNTQRPLTAYAFADNFPSLNKQTAFYSIKDPILNPFNGGATSTGSIKLVKCIINRNISPVQYTYADITPSSFTSLLNKANISSIIVDPKNANKIWVGVGNINLGPVIKWPGVDPSSAILFSSDGGSTWIDVSNGLPANIPIHCLEYWRGTDDIIFAGTEKGVFVFEKTATNGTGNWIPFNAPSSISLPVFADVVQLKINYCSSKLRAAVFGRSLWESDLPCIPSSVALPKTITQTQIKTLNKSEDNLTSIEVANNSTYTIRSNGASTFEFGMPLNSKIVVKPGSTLILDNVILTNRCDNFWEGIKVENGGEVQLINGAELHHFNKITVDANGIFNAIQGSLIELDNNSSIIVNQNALFNAKGNINLKSSSNITVDANGIFDAQQGSLTLVDDNSLIDVKQGGKLIISNGSVQLNGSNASVYIKGTLQIPANTDLTLNGTGFYQFGVGNNIVLNQGSKIDISGNGLGHQMIRLDDNTTVMINGHEMKLSNGDITYGHASKIEMAGGLNLEVSHCSAYKNILNANHAANAFSVSGTRNVLIDHSDFAEFSEALYFHDYPVDCFNPIPNINVKNCQFDNNGGADIHAKDLQRTNVKIKGCTLTNNTTNNGIELSNCNSVELIGNEISAKRNCGIVADNVNQLIVNGGHVYSNLNHGVEANNVNLYVRNGAVIQYNNNDGININYGSAYATNKSSSLTIGDWGCAWIISNNGYGVNVNDCHIYADAYEHSVINGIGIKSNRFDNNGLSGSGSAFNIRYSYPFWSSNLNLLSTESFKYNYWGSGINTFNGSVCFESNTSPNCLWPSNWPINTSSTSFLDASNSLAALPTGCTANNFDPNEIDPYDPNNTSARLSQTHIEIPQELIDATLTTEEPAGRLFVTAYRKMLDNNIDEATFMLADYLAVADPTALPDVHFEVTQALSQKLAVQLYALDPCSTPYDPSQPQARKAKLNQIKESISKRKSSSQRGISIYPNPFETKTTVSFNNDVKETFVCTVYNMQGQSVKTMQNIESNSFTIDASLMPKGMYWIELKSKTKSYREKLVVE